MKTEDTEAWYRQFWPWFIISLPATAVIAGLYTLWLSMQTIDSLVVQNDAPADVEARRLSVAATIDIQPETGAVKVILRGIQTDDAPKSLQLVLRHATLASRDARISLARSISTSDGLATFSGHFVQLPVGRHYLVLSAGDHWRLLATWNGQSTIDIDAGG